MVFNGDVLCGTDLTAVVDTHRRTDAEVTLHLVRVQNPRAFGCVPTAPDGRVAGVPGEDRGSADRPDQRRLLRLPPLGDRLDPGAAGRCRWSARRSPGCSPTGARVSGPRRHRVLARPGYPRRPGPRLGRPGARRRTLGGPARPDRRRACVLDGAEVAPDALVFGGTTVGPRGAGRRRAPGSRASMLFDGAVIGAGALVEHSVIGAGAQVRGRCRGRSTRWSVTGPSWARNCELRHGARIWPDVVLPPHGVRFSPGCLTAGRPASGGRTSRSISPACSPRSDAARGDPTCRHGRARRARVAVARRAPRRPGHHADAPARRTAPWSPRRGVRARRGRSTGLPALLGRARPSRRVRRAPPAGRRRRPAPARPAVRRVQPGVGRAGAVGAGAEGHRHRGPALVAGAVLALRRPGARPRPRRDARAADARRRSARCPSGSGTGPASTTPAAARSSPAPQSRTGWSAAAELGGTAGSVAAAAGARHRRVDRCRGGAAGLGRPRRRQLRRLPHPHARRVGAARSGHRRRRDGRGPRAVRAAAPDARCGYVEVSGFRRPRFGPRFSPRDYRAI